jgi:uncharacterized protein (TIGR02268 family)
MRARRVLLPESPVSPVPEVRAAPGFLTSLEFDAPIAPESLSLEGPPERFARADVTHSLVALRPALPLAEGERLLVSVRYTDGRVPSRATLALVAATDEVDVQVQVVRRARSAPELQAELDSVRARCEAGSLLQVVLAGMVEGGMTEEKLIAERGTGELTADRVLLHRTRIQAIATALLKLPAGSRRWVPGEARVLDTSGRVLLRLPMWLEGEALEPGEERQVGVQFEWPQESAPGPLRLALYEKHGERHVLLREP